MKMCLANTIPTDQKCDLTKNYFPQSGNAKVFKRQDQLSHGKMNTLEHRI